MALRIVWNYRGSGNAFRALRLDPKVQADIARRAEAVADAAGEGFEAFPTTTPRNRARAAVVPVTAEAAVQNARENTLIRALDAGKA